jgi:hypothetical protein
MQKEYDAATVAAAKQAVNTLWGFRYDMADTGTLELFWSEARYIRSEAKAAGRKIADADWIYLAGLADNVCVTRPRIRPRARPGLIRPAAAVAALAVFTYGALVFALAL